jgi:glycosyltransferase involved in cell wall biosynthesis
MRILTFTSLYPNSAFPVQGIFVATRLRKLLERSGWQAKVVAPVPWSPLSGKRFGRYGKMASVPAHETLHGIDVRHPRFFVVPKLSWMFTPFTMAAQAYGLIRRLQASGFDFDLIDAHYLFPDGVAAALIARRLEKPLVLTARGSDVNVIMKKQFPLRMILWATRRADAVISVSSPLKKKLASSGVYPDKLLHLRNGVDLDRFSPIDRDRARHTLGLSRDETVITSVGNLIPLKGHDLVITALKKINRARLLLVGAGPEEKGLRAQAQKEGLASRVDFLGQLDQSKLTTVYSAADALVLASSNEGWPNVLLEAMACGCPVIATNIPGSREIVKHRHAGLLISERNPHAIQSGLENLLADPPLRSETRSYAEAYNWDETSNGQIELFRRIIQQKSPGVSTDKPPPKQS